MKQLRRVRGLTQVELALEAGVHPSTVARLEQGTTQRPHDEEFASIARALGVGPEDLLDAGVRDDDARVERREEARRVFEGNLRAEQAFLAEAADADPALYRLLLAEAQWQRQRLLALMDLGRAHDGTAPDGDGGAHGAQSSRNG